MPTTFRTLGTLGACGRHVPPVAAGVAVAAVAASLMAEPGPGGVLAAGLALVVVAIAVVDLRSFLIPDGLNAAALLLGLAYAATTAQGMAQDVTEALAVALLRGAALAGLFLALRAAYRHLRGREGLGLGDVKLAAVAGVWLEVGLIPVAVDLAALAALLAVGLAALAGGRGVTMTARLPFGLFFGPAIWIGWYAGRVLGLSD